MEVDGFGSDRLVVGGEQPSLPNYLPMIYHRGVLEPSRSPPWVAIPLHVLSGKHPGGALYSRYHSAAALRRAFGLHETTKVVAVGVGKDAFIEDYWADRMIMALGRGLANMDLALAIPPNYSVWDDDPRVHHLYNRKRSLVVAHDWTTHGTPVAPYVVGTRPADWRFWMGVYEANPELRFLVKEFQTGLLRRERAMEALAEAADLQDRLGRELHFIALGGYQYADEIARRFGNRWTVIESTPFMRAVHRRRAYGPFGTKITWRSFPDGHVPALFANNWRVRSEALQERVMAAVS